MNAPRAAALAVVSVVALSLCAGAQPSTLDLPLPAIFVMNADGSGQRMLTDDGLWSGNPDWSPTGDKIAYTKWPDGHNASSIWVVDTDGSNGHSVYDDGQSASEP